MAIPGAAIVGTVAKRGGSTAAKRGGSTAAKRGGGPAAKRGGSTAARAAGKAAAEPAGSAGWSWPLRTAIVVVGVEGVALGTSSLALIVYQLTGHGSLDALNAGLVIGFAALGALALFFVWRGLVRGSRRARSPAVLTQLLAIPIGASAISQGAWWYGVPLLAGGIAGLIGLFAPSSTEVFYG